jgi:divalent metal cation (Fe/Co/Zn/Cd) transporter
MAMASIQVGEKSVTTMVTGVTVKPPTYALNYVTLAVLISTIFIKAVLYAYCYKVRHISSSVEALAEDHRNDALTNALAVVAIVVAHYYPVCWWFDR